MAVINFPDPAGQTPLNTFSPTSTPSATSNGMTYKWSSNSWTIISSADDDAVIPNPGGPDNQPGTLDDRYVKLAGGTGAQEITGTGGLKTEGLVESGGGVKVTGGKSANLVSGIGFDGGLVLSSGGEEQIKLAPNGRVNIIGNSTTNRSIVITGNSEGSSTYGLLVNTSSNTSGGNHYQVRANGSLDGTVQGYYQFFADNPSGSGAAEFVSGFYARDSLAVGTKNNYGFISNLRQDGSKNFNFIATNNAPNFFAGSTYIGGTTTRNTRELWESTLTEEQKEQLAVGTLAIPANVSTPGDGEFARAWYYDQQDAEIQALLDSGELEYPEQFAAATFTDTFDLGENTNINLIASSGIIENNGIQLVNSKGSADVNSRGIVWSAAKDALLSTNRPDAAGDDVDVFASRVDPTNYDNDGDRSPVNIGVSTCFKAEAPAGNNVGEFGTFDGHKGFTALSVPSNTSTAVWTGTDNVYGFYSAVNDRTENTGRSYGFYAAGDAPNFFKGSTYIGGTHARNTLELWKSTLTEEQLEQYEAGTYAVPANVSTPGDGSFARQWWYDQQSAEDQALIDAGELEYPSHFQAANFVDTFDLGDNTIISLTSTGTLGSVRVKTGAGYAELHRSGSSSVTPVLDLHRGGDTASGANFNAITVDTEQDTIFNLAYSGNLSTRGTISAAQDTFTVDAGGKIVSDAGASFTKQVEVDADFDNPSLTSFASFVVRQAGAGSASLNTLYGVKVDNQAEAALSTNGTVYGVWSDISNKTDPKEGFNFYAAGTAPNFFAGVTYIGNNDQRLYTSDQAIGLRLITNANDASRSALEISSHNTANNTAKRAINFTKCDYTEDRDGDDFKTTAGFITVSAEVGAAAGVIYNCGANTKENGFASTSDYRLKENFTSIDNAVDRVKSLKPKRFNYIGSESVVDGFVAHELSEGCPAAVFGTKDATEAIGTLADYDGTVLETEVTEPDELTYTEDVTDEEGVTTQEVRTRTWTATGTQPVYQGVDQTKLIPLLTKALQEALERIEALENA